MISKIRFSVLAFLCIFRLICSIYILNCLINISAWMFRKISNWAGLTFLLPLPFQSSNPSSPILSSVSKWHNQLPPCLNPKSGNSHRFFWLYPHTPSINKTYLSDLPDTSGINLILFTSVTIYFNTNYHYLLPTLWQYLSNWFSSFHPWLLTIHFSYLKYSILKMVNPSISLLG